MPSRMRFSAALTASALLCVVGCNSGGASTSSNSSHAGASGAQNDSAGEEPLPKKVRIAQVTRSPNGDVNYVLDNLWDDDLSNVSCRIYFYYPPTVGKSAVDILEDILPSDQDLYLAKGETGHVVAAKNPDPARKVIATRIEIGEDPPVAVVVGTRFLNDELECVRLSSGDDLIGSNPALWIELKNSSNHNVTAFEAVAVFLRQDGTKATESKKAKAKAMASGETQRVTFDLADMGRLGSYSFLVKVRRVRKF